MDKKALGQRIRQLREARGMGVVSLASKMGFNSHQLVGRIEEGEREVKAAEIAKLAGIFGVPLSHFFKETSPKGCDVPLVLWRSEPEEAERIAQEARFFQMCNDRNLFTRLLGISDSGSLPLPRCGADHVYASRDAVYQLAENVRNALNLGDFPSRVLTKVLSERYGARFFETTSGGSAACTWVNDIPYILVNTEEVPWRQHFSIAHELYHLLTWHDGIVELSRSDPDHKQRDEKNADAFAAGLLMPTEKVKGELHRLCPDGKLSMAALVSLARSFDVSLSACIYRLVKMGCFPYETANRLASNSELSMLDSQTPRLRNDHSMEIREPFLHLGFLCLQKGKISRAKLAKALNVPLVDLPTILADAGFFEMETEESVDLNNF